MSLPSVSHVWRRRVTHTDPPRWPWGDGHPPWQGPCCCNRWHGEGKELFLTWLLYLRDGSLLYVQEPCHSVTRSRYRVVSQWVCLCVCPAAAFNGTDHVRCCVCVNVCGTRPCLAYTYINSSIHIYAYVQHAYMHAHIRTNIYTNKHTCMYKNTQKYMHAYINPYKNPYKQTYIHTRVLVRTRYTHIQIVFVCFVFQTYKYIRT